MIIMKQKSTNGRQVFTFFDLVLRETCGNWFRKNSEHLVFPDLCSLYKLAVQ